MLRHLDDQESPEEDVQPRGYIPLKNRTRHLIFLSAVLAATLALVSATACDDNGADVAPPPAAEPGPVPSAGPAAQPAGTVDADLVYDPLVITAIAIDIDTNLAVVCGLDESKVFFQFDSTKLLPAAKERLQRIAACSKTGPIKGQALLMVGRTDSVGPDEYNKLLGMSRADAVAKYLRELGVDKTQIVTESRGEAAAKEKYPWNWPYNRRVTIRLLPPPGTESPGQ